MRFRGILREEAVLPEYLKWTLIVRDRMGGILNIRKYKYLLKGLSSEERVCEALYCLRNNSKSRIAEFINTSAIRRLDDRGWDFLITVVAGSARKFIPIQVKSSGMGAKRYRENHKGENVLMIIVDKRDTCFSLMKKIEAGIDRILRVY